MNDPMNEAIEVMKKLGVKVSRKRNPRILELRFPNPRLFSQIVSGLEDNELTNDFTVNRAELIVTLPR